MSPDSMDAVFQALAHSCRRRILDIVANEPGCRVGDVCEAFSMSRIGVLKHIRVLEDAGLLISEKEGRERHLYLNAAPLQLITDRWLTQYSRYWAKGVTRIKFAVEDKGESA